MTDELLVFRNNDQVNVYQWVMIGFGTEKPNAKQLWWGHLPLARVCGNCGEAKLSKDGLARIILVGWYFFSWKLACVSFACKRSSQQVACNLSHSWGLHLLKRDRLRLGVQADREGFNGVLPGTGFGDFALSSLHVLDRSIPSLGHFLCIGRSAGRNEVGDM